MQVGVGKGGVGIDVVASGGLMGGRRGHQSSDWGAGSMGSGWWCWGAEATKPHTPLTLHTHHTHTTHTPHTHHTHTTHTPHTPQAQGAPTPPHMKLNSPLVACPPCCSTLARRASRARTPRPLMRGRATDTPAQTPHPGPAAGVPGAPPGNCSRLRRWLGEGAPAAAAARRLPGKLTLARWGSQCRGTWRGGGGGRGGRPGDRTEARDEGKGRGHERVANAVHSKTPPPSKHKHMDTWRRDLGGHNSENA